MCFARRGNSMNSFRKISRSLLALLLAILMFQGINVHAELASNIDINVDQDDLLDIVLTLGKTDSTIDTFEADLIAALVNKGVPQDKIKIQAVESSEVSAGNTSEGWEIYDHTNYTTNVINYYRPYYSETNGNYVLYNHIVPTITTSTNIDFFGYGAPGYKDFMFMPNDETGKKTFDFTIQEGEFYDALNGAGFLFNTTMSSNTNLASRTMSGYLLFFQYPYGGAPTIRVYKFTNIDVNAFHNSTGTPIQSYAGFTEIASYAVGTETTRKVKIEATADELTMWYNDVLVNFTLANSTKATTVPLTTDFGGYGFGPLVGYLSHGCSLHTHFTFYNVRMSTESTRRFSEVIREPEWRDQSKRFIINAEDGAVSDFSDAVALGEILARLGNENIHYLGWGKNDVDGNAFIAKNSGNGLFVDKDAAATDTYAEQVQALATYIYAKYIDGVENDTEKLIYGKPSSLSITPASEQTNTIDADWPQGKWRIDHDPTYFENSTGTVPYDNLYLNNLDISFTESGKYEIYYQDILVKTVYVHRKPVAKFTVAVDGSYNVSITNQAYDPDQESTADKGIKSTNWYYKLTTDASWTSGTPTVLSANKEYIFKQVVVDEYGVESDPYLRYVSTTVSAQAVPVAEFNITPSRLLTYVSTLVGYADTSYDPQGIAITDRLWTITKDGTSVYSGSTAKTNFSDFAAGVYKISLKVKNANNVWSQEVSRYLTVVKDTVGVSVVSDTASGSFTAKKTVTLSFEDDENGSGFSHRYVVVSNSATVPSQWGSMGTNASYSYQLSSLGVNYIHYQAYDYAGNVTTGKFGPFTLSDIAAPSTPTLTHEPTYVNGTWSKEIIKITASGSTDNFTAENDLVYSVSLDGVNYVVGNTKTLSVDGNHTVYFKVTDASGNSTVTSSVVKLDLSAPTKPSLALVANGSAYTAGTWTRFSVSGTLSGSNDAGGSLLKEYQYKIDDGNWTVGSIFTLSDTGTYTVGYRSIDFAGNLSETGSAVIKVDKTLPEAFEIVAISQTIDSIDISASTNDLHSGLAPLAYRYFDGTSWSAWMSSLDVVAKGYTRHQIVEILVEAMDAAGNVRQVSKTVTTLANTDPSGVNDVFDVTEDALETTLDVLANDLDLDFDTPLEEALEIVSISDFTKTEAGTLSIVDNTIHYTPAANYHGQFSFTYTMEDAFGSPSTATVTVIVAAVNDAPVANDDGFTMDEDGSLELDVLKNDEDVDSEFAIVSFTEATHGVVTLVDGKLSYEPNLNYNGTDTFTYTISDGELTSTATIELTIDAVNDAPVANDDDFTLDEDGSLELDVLDNDSDVDNSFSILSFTEASHGVVTLIDGKLTYTPNLNYNGTDAFTYTISDGELTSTATIELTINAVNDAPVAVGDKYRFNEDGTLTMDVLLNDADLDSIITIQSFTSAKHGKVTLVSGKLVYQPFLDFNGTDGFTYTITDGKLTATTMVDLTVDAVNDAPVLGLDEGSTRYHTPVTLDVLANDSDVENDALSIIDVHGALHGVVTIVDNKVLYTPDALFAGEDTFTVVVSDGNIERSSSVTVRVSEPDTEDATPFDPTPEDPGNPGDPEDDKEIEVDQPGSKGDIIIVNDTVYYTPKKGESGIDTYTITVKEDGKEITYQVVTKIVDGKATVVGFGQPIGDESFEVANNQKLTVKLNDYLSADLMKGVASVSVEPEFGTVTLKNGVLTYKPSKEYVGKDGVVLMIKIDNQETPFAALINVTEAAPSTIPWVCIFGWLVAALFLAFNYKKHEPYFKPSASRIASYIILNTMVILALCLLREVVGYPIAMGSMLVWLALNFFFAKHQVDKIHHAA